MWKKICLWGFSLTSLFVGIDWIFHPHITEFCLYDIINTCPSSPVWELPVPSLEEQKNLNQIFSQKFTYLGKGMQSYAFISEDKNYVLKFFKQRQMRARSWIDLIPFSWNRRYDKHQARKEMERLTFSSCTTAYKELKNETGLIYVHINQSHDLNKKVTIIDENKRVHSVPLGSTCFCIQKYATLIYPCISELMQQGRITEAKNSISAVFDLIESLGKKGVTENDPLLYRNFGLIQNAAIQIDVGKLCIDTKRQNTSVYKNDVVDVTKDFKQWLEDNHPSLLKHFEQCLQKVLL